MALHVSCSSFAWAIRTWWGMLRFWKVPLHLQCASWSIVQFSRFKLIIWPAESNSKQCGQESGWNWRNYHIWYANRRRTHTQMHSCVCIQICWHLFATLNTMPRNKARINIGYQGSSVNAEKSCKLQTDSVQHGTSLCSMPFHGACDLRLEKSKKAQYMCKRLQSEKIDGCFVRLVCA